MDRREVKYYITNFVLTLFSVGCGVAIGHYLTLKEESAKAVKAGAAHWVTGEDGCPKFEYVKFNNNYSLR